MSNTVVLCSNAQDPVTKSVHELLSAEQWEVKRLPLAQMTADSDVACLFITSTDLPEVSQLTQSFLSGANGARLIWVAPACSESGEVGSVLASAKALVHEADAQALIVRYGPLFSDIMANKNEIRNRRTLSLSLGASGLAWVAPQDVAEVVAKGVMGQLDESRLVVSGALLTGEALASGLSQTLKENLSGTRFAQRRFEAIDVNQDGELSHEELTPYLAELGYSIDEINAILDEADVNKDGVIEFDEFVRDMSGQLDLMLAEISSQVHYLNVPESAALQDMSMRGIDDETARLSLALLKNNREQPLPAATDALAGWLGRPATSFSEWAGQQVLSFLNVHILPGRGILSISEGRFANRAARIMRLVYPSGRVVLGRRTLDGEVVELRWNDVSSDEVETVRFAENGSERKLEIKEDRLVGLHVTGRWPGLRLATQLLFAESKLPRWQISLFRELGELQLESDADLGTPTDVICNCTGMTRGTVSDLIESGCEDVATLAEQTRVTTICGGCQPLVEEMFGSTSLSVAELLDQTPVGQKFIQCRFRPVDAEVVQSRPGEHIVLQGRINGRWVTRAYTLSSPANQQEAYEVTVKREEMGLFSRWLSDHASADSLFRVSTPRGEFFLSDEDQGPIFFFAGGIGVTPAVAMMRSLANGHDTRHFHLDWSARFDEELIFLDELVELVGQHSNLTLTTRATRVSGRIDAEQVRERYPYQAGSIAFLCGPVAFMKTMHDYLLGAEWPEEAIRQELFTSELDEEGAAQEASSKAAAPIQLGESGITPIEASSFNLSPIKSLQLEAKTYLQQHYYELGVPDAFEERWAEVKQSIEETGSYQHTADELSYGARLAWRNSTRCVGRYFWQHLHVRDLRHLETEEEMFASIVEHIKLGTNGGDLRAVLTVFRTGDPKIRIWNGQLILYAGYRQPDGRILGDPNSVALTEQAMKLGWRGAGTRFDILPLIIQIEGREPRWFEYPPEIILEVPISHPRFEWFEELGLKWFAVPAVSGMALDMGGIQYSAAPSNGFYMGTEIGSLNFGDKRRYNMLPLVADKMGLDRSEERTLWRDQALVEVNIAVLHSFRKHGVRMLDHHALSDYFMRFNEQEEALGRTVYGHWPWLVPPLSSSTSDLWHYKKWKNRILKPNYFYQPDPWKKKGAKAASDASDGNDGNMNKCPMH